MPYLGVMRLLRTRSSQLERPIEPCLPRLAKAPPIGPDWIHEVKHDGFRVLGWREAAGVGLFTRKGVDLARRFPLIAAAVAALPVRTCLIDGEAIACDERGVAVFELIRYRRQDYAVTLSAFDLLEIDGEDMRNAPIEQRKQALARLLTRSYNGITLNAHYGGDGAVIFKRACQLGHEGIVSKRLGSPYCSGRSDQWMK